MFTGSCLCGRVRLRIDGEVRSARYCHCANCRKFSGTAYAAWGLVRTAELEVTPADAQVSKYHSGGGARVFCSACGSPLWFEPDGVPAFRGLPLGVLDGGDITAPAMHVWTKSMVSWVTLPEGTPHHPTHP